MKTPAQTQWTASEKNALLSLYLCGVIGSHMGGYAKRKAWFEKCKKAGLLNDKMHLTTEGMLFCESLKA